MKACLRLLFISTIFLTFSCKKDTTNQKTEKQTETIKPKKQLQDSAVVQKKLEKHKHYIWKYANVKSGLNYRDSPNGKILDKFPLNTPLKIIENTKIFDKVEYEGKTRDGEWLGVENENDTVYVLSPFLSDFYNYSDIQLFYASPYYKDYDEIREGFVNLSQLYPFDYENNSSTIIPEEKLGEEPIKFSKNQNDKILERLGISKKDSLYIFSFSSDSVYKFQISELKMIAHLNIYAHAKDNNITEVEYEIGLNLEDKFSEKGDSFAYIGNENPFQTGKIKPLIWNRTDNTNFPLQEHPVNPLKNTDNVTRETYTLSLSKFKYFIQSYIQNKNNRSRVQRHQLVIIDTTTNKITNKLNYQSSESIDISPVHKSSDEKMDYYYSWTGELFKNKPPIIYGLYGNSFGCTTVDFIYENEPPIRLLCDNRH